MTRRLLDRLYDGAAWLAALFMIGIVVVFAAPSHDTLTDDLAYMPLLFLALTALLWGVRGASLAAFAGTLVALEGAADLRGRIAFAQPFVLLVSVAVFSLVLTARQDYDTNLASQVLVMVGVGAIAIALALVRRRELDAGV